MSNPPRPDLMVQLLIMCSLAGDQLPEPKKTNINLPKSPVTPHPSQKHIASRPHGKTPNHSPKKAYRR